MFKIISNKVGKSFEPYRVFLRPLRDKIRLTHRSIEEYLIEKKPITDIEEKIKNLIKIFSGMKLYHTNKVARLAIVPGAYFTFPR